MSSELQIHCEPLHHAYPRLHKKVLPQATLNNGETLMCVMKHLLIGQSIKWATVLWVVALVEEKQSTLFYSLYS